ncbi:probable serine/threonine-protein kinase fhkB [Teleopsis dalmanni]|uniref:probable serine/threonine-protein kinase fhkB n=1 Tax=Teleopsis dalmanni TaxID=139649 RepID=UPI0018CDE330|nr:probable serine/threonine-protein kinase fhkB [Teleopsis dalmanni]
MNMDNKKSLEVVAEPQLEPVIESEDESSYEPLDSDDSFSEYLNNMEDMYADIENSSSDEDDVEEDSDSDDEDYDQYYVFAYLTFTFYIIFINFVFP